MDVTKKSIKNLTKQTNVSYTVKSFGEKLVQLRNEKGITQAESAELIGITRNTLSMYERNERCPNIDIAVNTANVYNVSLDYLFGIGYKSKEKNDVSLFDLGFSEKAVDLLTDETVKLYINEMLSDVRFDLIRNMMYGLSYKPLINSYEVNYISRLISDMLYQIIVTITKDAYKIRPMLEEEYDELISAIHSCLGMLLDKGELLHTDYDQFVNCEENIELELEHIKYLLEDSPITSYNSAKEAGFQDAIKMIRTGNIYISSPIDKDTQNFLDKQISLQQFEYEKLQKYREIIEKKYNGRDENGRILTNDQIEAWSKKMYEEESKK